jgi:hypothetical protein
MPPRIRRRTVSIRAYLRKKRQGGTGPVRACQRPRAGEDRVQLRPRSGDECTLVPKGFLANREATNASMGKLSGASTTT